MSHPPLFTYLLGSTCMYTLGEFTEMYVPVDRRAYIHTHTHTYMYVDASGRVLTHSTGTYNPIFSELFTYIHAVSYTYLVCITDARPYYTYGPRRRVGDTVDGWKQLHYL